MRRKQGARRLGRGQKGQEGKLEWVGGRRAAEAWAVQEGPLHGACKPWQVTCVDLLTIAWTFEKPATPAARNIATKGDRAPSGGST